MRSLAKALEVDSLQATECGKESKSVSLFWQPWAGEQGRTRSRPEVAGKFESYLWDGCGVVSRLPNLGWEEWGRKQGTEGQSWVPGLGLPLRGWAHLSA